MIKNIDIVICSFLRPHDGGRETWLRQWIPAILDADSFIRFRVFAINDKSKHDKSIFDEMQPHHRSRIEIVKFNCSISRGPLILQFLLKFFYYYRFKNSNKVNMVIGIGGFYEAMMIYLSCSKKKCKYKLLWLRCIFSEEVAGRFPSFLVGFIKKLEKFFLKRHDHCIANGKDTFEYYKKYNIPVVTISNAVHLKKWDIGRPDFSLPINVAYVGRIAKIKGITEFCAAAEYISKSEHANRLAFDIVGDGDIAVKNHILTLQKKNVLNYHGSIANDDLPLFLKKIDVCVGLSFKSSKGGAAGVSNALLEQLAARRIMVVWDNIIFRNVVDRQSAYFVKQGDAEGLAECFINLLTSKQRLLEMSDESLCVASRYSFDNQVDAFFSNFNYMIEDLV